MKFVDIVKQIFLTLLYEIIWFFYIVFIVIPSPLIVKLRKKGETCKPPYIICPIHVGNFDPVFITRVTRAFRLRAMYQVDGPYPFLKFFYKSIWRFRVSQNPKIKEELNKRTIRNIIIFLKNGGKIMIYPEGYWNWQKIIYPGVAKIAHESNTPIIPTGIENGYTFRPELDNQPPLKAIGRILSDYRKLKKVTIHFDEPIYPDQSLKESEDISRIMDLLESKFDEYYRDFYNIEGPKKFDKN